MDNVTPILKLRTEALRANLEKLKDHMASFPDPRTELKNLGDRLASAWKSLNDLRYEVSDTRIGVESELSPTDIAKNLGATEQKMETLVIELKRAETEIKSMQAKCYRIDEHEIGSAIADDLEHRTKNPIQALADIEVDLRDPGVNFQKQWEAFFGTTDAVSQTIFTEYIEFLGGFALRDTGFDAGISRVADELLRSYTTKRNLHMMAIPTRQQAVAVTLARIVRVTFPDWTIWSLPSTAHEFWHVVASQDLEVKLRSNLRQITGIKDDAVEARFNTCLGDAFATYTMGPAYAFSAIFLQLDPLSPFTPIADAAAHDVRAHSICEMLACMDSKESVMDRPYSDVRKQLTGAWADAIIQTGVKATIDEEKQILGDKLRATELVRALWTTLKDSTSPPFTVEIWNEIRSWVTPLLQGNVDVIEMPHGAELRHVLNAAWLARVHPERKEDITAIANKLAQRVTVPEKRDH